MKYHVIAINDDETPIDHGFIPYKLLPNGDRKQCLPSEYEIALNIGTPTYLFYKDTSFIIVNKHQVIIDNTGLIHETK